MLLVSTVRVDPAIFVRYETLRRDCWLGIRNKTPTLLAIDICVCESLRKFLACFKLTALDLQAQLLVLSCKVSFPQLISKMMSVLPLLALQK